MSAIWLFIFAPSWLFGALRVFPTCAGGLAAVAVSHLFALVYEVRRYQKHHPLARDAMLRVTNHLVQPGGFALLAAYLMATWHGKLLPLTYYATTTRGVSFSRVATQLVVQDCLMFLAHRVEHYLKLRGHFLHHTLKRPVAFDAFDGSIEDTIYMILIPLFLTAHVCAIFFDVNVYDYMAFGSIYANALFFLHSDAEHEWDEAFRRLKFGTQRDHHQHHKNPSMNFGHLFMWWDAFVGSTAKQEI